MSVLVDCICDHISITSSTINHPEQLFSWGDAVLVQKYVWCNALHSSTETQVGVARHAARLIPQHHDMLQVACPQGVQRYTPEREAQQGRVLVLLQVSPMCAGLC